MAQEDRLQEKLLDYIEDAHAMEQSVLRMLDSMISTTPDPEIEQMLRHHKDQTEVHEQRLRERLEALGRGTSTRKEMQTVANAWIKGAADKARGDQAGKNARDGYITESMEIASYELLERLANRTGDTQTAEVARQNRAEDEAMAQSIASNWDKFLDLTLAEAGIQANLVNLNDTDLHLEEPWQDLRGLDVHDSNGEQIGSVEDVYVDREERVARLLVVSAGGFLGIGKKHFLVPVEEVKRAVDADRITVEHPRDKVLESPEFDPDKEPDFDALQRSVYAYYGHS